jgi:16S rRNA (adenine1518-N6/adenine1519-N6)-dimethyltransferase
MEPKPEEGERRGSVAPKEVLERLGLRPSRRLGQNFLVDGNWIGKLTASLPPRRTVVEIGPGTGALTRALVERGHPVRAIEIDHRLCRHLEATFAGEDFRLREGDAVRSPLAGLERSEGPLALVANLPFAITSPWIDALLRPGLPLPAPLVLVLQREGMERLGADVGTPAYGPTAIRMRLAYRLRTAGAVPRGAFHPRPAVESRFGTWDPLPEPVRLPPEAASLLRSLFGNRRKMLRHAMRRNLAPEAIRRWEEILARHGKDPAARPQELSPRLWRELLADATGSAGTS